MEVEDGRRTETGWERRRRRRRGKEKNLRIIVFTKKWNWFFFRYRSETINKLTVARVASQFQPRGWSFNSAPAATYATGSGRKRN